MCRSDSLNGEQGAGLLQCEVGRWVSPPPPSRIEVTKRTNAQIEVENLKGPPMLAATPAPPPPCRGGHRPDSLARLTARTSLLPNLGRLPVAGEALHEAV